MVRRAPAGNRVLDLKAYLDAAAKGAALGRRRQAPRVADHRVPVGRRGDRGQLIAADPDRLTSIVLLTDGERTVGADLAGFTRHYQALAAVFTDIRGYQ